MSSIRVRFYLKRDTLGQPYPAMGSEHRDLDGLYLLDVASGDMRQSARQADIEVCRREGEGYVWGNAACLLFSETDVRICLLYTSPSPRDATLSRMPSSA